MQKEYIEQYVITATVTEKRGDGSSVRQVPTFVLDASIQGIVSIDHAERIARSMFLPAGNPNGVKVSVCAEEMKGRRQ